MNPFVRMAVLGLFVAGALVAKEPAGRLKLKAGAFPWGGTIPIQFTCDGANISPALAWNRPPAGTKSFALIVDDPDAPAGTWVHWVVYNLPATMRNLPEGVPQGESIGGSGNQGFNDFLHTGYGGPCPPPGQASPIFLPALCA